MIIMIMTMILIIIMISAMIMIIIIHDAEEKKPKIIKKHIFERTEDEMKRSETE